MKQDALNYINNKILSEASKLSYQVKAIAPSTEVELFNATSLVIWSGASDCTIFRDERVNWAFSALHDVLHLKTRYTFNADSEIELGRLQASQYSSQLMQELVFAEVSLQATHFKTTGSFVVNQIEFTEKHLIKAKVL